MVILPRLTLAQWGGGFPRPPSGGWPSAANPGSMVSLPRLTWLIDEPFHNHFLANPLVVILPRLTLAQWCLAFRSHFGGGWLSAANLGSVVSFPQLTSSVISLSSTS